jgi:hypothetical protein
LAQSHCAIQMTSPSNYSRQSLHHTRGFTKRALKRRAEIPDIEALVTLQSVHICAFGFSSSRFVTKRKNRDESGTNRRSMRSGGASDLRLRTIHVQQNEMNRQIVFQKSPTNVKSVPASPRTAVSFGWRAISIDIFLKRVAHLRDVSWNSPFGNERRLGRPHRIFKYSNVRLLRMRRRYTFSVSYAARALNF